MSIYKIGGGKNESFCLDLFFAIFVQAMPPWGQSESVSLNGKKWFRPTDFFNLTRNDFNSVCPLPGAKFTGALGSIDVTGFMVFGMNSVPAVRISR